jgi:high-affinity iron transporter
VRSSTRTGSRPGPARRAVPAAALAVTVLTVALAAAGGAAVSGRSGDALAISESTCGDPPAVQAAGPVDFTVTDEARDFAAVYLIKPAGNLVYAEIPSLPPGASRPLAATLGAGSYAVRCVFTNGVIETSNTYEVRGTTQNATAGFAPLPDLDMEGPVDAYRAYVGAALPGLLTACQTLDADVARGDLAAAEADWLAAHLDYERLGAAYNSFGDFDDAIDGTATGLPQGTATASWTGFFRLEYGLWHGQGAAALKPYADRLVSSVQGLIADFPSEEVDPGDLPLRAHEILENALQFQLTGIADYGSGTTLATVYANTQGTAEVLGVLKPLITARAAGLLPTIDGWIGAVQADLLADRSADGTWTPVSQLSTSARQRLDGDLGELLEQLSVIPNLLAPRTSA